MPRPQFRLIPGTTVAFNKQLATAHQGPVVLFNLFVVPSERREAFMQYWLEDATYMKAQYGIISTQLHQGIAGSNIYINIAQWESAESLSRAIYSEKFQTALERCPEGVITYPLLLQKEGVPGICLA